MGERQPVSASSASASASASLSLSISISIGLSLSRGAGDRVGNCASPQLADQLERAATSAALNVAEGARSQGRNEAARYHCAAGSASEARAALAIAEAWGHISNAQRAPAEAKLDRLGALLWGLTHRK